MNNIVKRVINLSVSIMAVLFCVILMAEADFAQIPAGSSTPAPTPTENKGKGADNSQKSDDKALEDLFNQMSDADLNDKAFDGLNAFLAKYDAETPADLIAEGYYDAARQKLDAIIKAEPKNAGALAERALAAYEKHVAQYDNDDQKDAMNDAETAIELEPNNAFAHWVLGQIYGEDRLLTGDESRAENAKARALAGALVNRAPNDAESYYLRALTTQSDDGDDAVLASSTTIADLTKAIGIDPKFSRAYYRRALSFYGAHNYERALADFNKVVELTPKSINAYYYRGMTYHALGIPDKAAADLHRAAALDPQNQNLKNLLWDYEHSPAAGEKK